jgi:hypothetical protein
MISATQADLILSLSKDGVYGSSAHGSILRQAQDEVGGESPLFGP